MFVIYFFLTRHDTIFCWNSYPIDKIISNFILKYTNWFKLIYINVFSVFYFNSICRTWKTNSSLSQYRRIYEYCALNQIIQRFVFCCSFLNKWNYQLTTDKFKKTLTLNIKMIWSISVFLHYQSNYCSSI